MGRLRSGGLSVSRMQSQVPPVQESLNVQCNVGHQCMRTPWQTRLQVRHPYTARLGGRVGGEGRGGGSGGVWWSTHKAVQTHGGAHTRQSVATAGVLLFKGGGGGGWPSSLRRGPRGGG